MGNKSIRLTLAALLLLSLLVRIPILSCSSCAGTGHIDLTDYIVFSHSIYNDMNRPCQICRTSGKVSVSHLLAKKVAVGP